MKAHRVVSQELDLPKGVPMPAMPVWERAQQEEQPPQAVAPALAMSARDPVRLYPPLRGEVQRLRHREMRPPLKTTGLLELVMGAIPAPAMLTRENPRHRNQLFECQLMPRSSDRLIRRAADHLMEDQVQVSHEVEAETATHHRRHRVLPQEAARVILLEHQVTLLRAGTLLEMAPNKRRKRRKRKEARLRTRQTHHIHDEGSVK